MENLCDLSVISSELLVNGMMKPAVYFHKIDEPNGFLSNWYPSNFEIDGMKFCNVEQYCTANALFSVILRLLRR